MLVVHERYTFQISILEPKSDFFFCLPRILLSERTDTMDDYYACLCEYFIFFYSFDDTRAKISIDALVCMTVRMRLSMSVWCVCVRVCMRGYIFRSVFYLYSMNHKYTHIAIVRSH